MTRRIDRLATAPTAATAGAPAIQVDDLVKRYRKADRNAVDGITFEVGAGEFFALLGPNGAGKTTTLSILTTTLAPTDGRALIDGLDVVADATAVRQRVGIIFQRPSLDKNLTGEENVRFHAILYGLYPYAPAYRLMAPGLPPPGRGAGRSCSGLGQRDLRPGPDVLGRDAAQARDRPEPHSPAAGPLPRRADDRAGRAEPARAVDATSATSGRRRRRRSSSPPTTSRRPSRRTGSA